MKAKTWTSRAGKLNRTKPREKGFTLIELVVVISIIALALFFTIPRFDTFQASSTSDSLARIVSLVSQLKQKALADTVDYIMNIDPSDGSVWVTSGDMDDEASVQAKENGFRISPPLIIQEVIFPGTRTAQEGTIQLRFSSKGYCDMARIIFQEGETEMTMKIEPFLTSVSIADGRLPFETCR